jgi:hypothetical protein
MTPHDLLALTSLQLLVPRWTIVHGIPRPGAGEGWAALARKHFLTDRSES